MEWLLLVFGGGGLALAARHLWDQRLLRRRDADGVQEMRRLAGDDVTRFGEELGRLDEQTLDCFAREDLQDALDAYERARRAADRIQLTDQVDAVSAALTDGRYALACIRARLAGEPLPERRALCYFNPGHGPSAADVEWTPAYGPTRRVPACAQDAARVRAGQEPELRYRHHPWSRAQYWEPDVVYEPFEINFYSSSGARAVVMALTLEMRGEGRGRWGIDHPGR